MITEFLIALTTGIVAGFLSMAPPLSLDTSAFQAVAGVMGRSGGLNGYFPIGTLALCLGLVFGLKVWMLGYRLVMFIYHQFWGSD